MSSVGAVNYILSNAAALLLQVPATRILSGPVPQDTTLPAISVRQVSGVESDFKPVAPTSPPFTADRVQVTVYASTYAAKKTILRLVRDALHGQRGSFNSIGVDSIVVDGEGPDLDDLNARIYEQSRDFIVRWHGA
jgi:hypothetical protein